VAPGGTSGVQAGDVAQVECWSYLRRVRSSIGAGVSNSWMPANLRGHPRNEMRHRMPSTAEIIREAESLPVEERTLVVDTLLRSLNPPDPEIDRKWAVVARRRLEELRSGCVKPIPGDEVFAKIRQRFAT